MNSCRTFFTFFIIFCLTASIFFGQTVSTLVEGPGGFNDALSVDKYGNIFASEYYGKKIIKITPNGETSIFSDKMASPNGTTFDSDGYLWVPNVNKNNICRISPEGIVDTVLKNISKPSGLIFDNDGNLIIAQYTDNTVSVLKSDGEIIDLPNIIELDGPVGFAKSKSGDIYISNFTDGKIFKFDWKSVSLEYLGKTSGWCGFIAIAGDYLYATGFQANRIYQFALDGSSERKSFAGSGREGSTDGSLGSSRFHHPNGIASSVTGDTLFISEYDSQRLRLITGLNQITDVEDEENLLMNFKLIQNYPNPFNPTTVIEYSIPANVNREMSTTTLIVYNLLGQQVAVLVNKQQSAGRYSVEFNASKLASGTYIYRLETDNFAASKKMLLMK